MKRWEGGGAYVWVFCWGCADGLWVAEEFSELSDVRAVAVSADTRHISSDLWKPEDTHA